MTDFGTFKIGDVIMHRVPSGRRDESQPDPIEYSEAPIELTTRDKGFIELRLRETLGGRARPVVEDADEESLVPDLVRGLLNGTGDLVIDSAALARGLHERQKWMSSVGLVMAILGKVDGEPCLVVAKMEHEEGMRVQETKTKDGKKTYKAEYLRDLILGEGTQVFKVGIFKRSGAKVGDDLTGEVVDVQQGSGAVAMYFVHFLGCQFTERPDVQTEKFYKETQRFIARVAKDDPERRADYAIALLSEMQSQAARINVEAFARGHLSADDQDDYIAQLTRSGLPLRGFRKDNELVKGHIKRMKVQTKRGGTVLVPPEMYEDGSMTVVELDGDESAITLTDEITGISGASGPKQTA